MLFRIQAISLTGPVRDGNEDCLFVNGTVPGPESRAQYEFSCRDRSAVQVCAVFDGMGGENSGEIASGEAARLLAECYPSIREAAKNRVEPGIRAVNEYVRSASQAIYGLSGEISGNRGMGTTFACLLIAGGEAAAVNAGDSRVYACRKGALTQLTRDHSESERLVRLGIITKEQALTHKSRNMLNRYLGVPPEEGSMEGDVSPAGRVARGDVFLLCSDGLTNLVTGKEILEALKKRPRKGGAARLLAEIAVDRGGSDNITVITVEIA